MAKRSLDKLSDEDLDEAITALSAELDERRRDELHPLIEARRQRDAERAVRAALEGLSPDQRERMASIIGANGIASGEAVGSPGRQ